MKLAPSPDWASIIIRLKRANRFSDILKAAYPEPPKLMLGIEANFPAYRSTHERPRRLRDEVASDENMEH